MGAPGKLFGNGQAANQQMKPEILAMTDSINLPWSDAGEKRELNAEEKVPDQADNHVICLLNARIVTKAISDYQQVQNDRVLMQSKRSVHKT